MANQIKGLKSMSKLSAGGQKLPALIEKLPVKYNWPGSRKSKRKGDENGAGKIEGRKSVSHVETSLNSVASFLQVEVLVSDMSSCKFMLLGVQEQALIVLTSLVENTWLIISKRSLINYTGQLGIALWAPTSGRL